MATGRHSSGVAGVLSLVGVGSALVLCCAGPVLIAGGALGILGGVLRSGWLIGAAVLVVLAGVAYTVVRRGRTEQPGCRPPVRSETSTDHHDRRTTP